MIAVADILRPCAYALCRCFIWTPPTKTGQSEIEPGQWVYDVPVNLPRPYQATGDWPLLTPEQKAWHATRPPCDGSLAREIAAIHERHVEAALALPDEHPFSTVYQLPKKEDAA